MNAGTNARDAVLARIRRALADVPAGVEPDADVPIARDYRMADDAPRATLIEHLADRLREYRATVHRVESEADLPRTIASVLSARGVVSMAVPADIPDAWIPPGVDAVRDDPAGSISHARLDRVDGVLTGCSLAIAQTGTIVLDGGPTQGRRVLSLLPDYHLCVVRDDQVVGLVPEAVARLRDRATRPQTWISGPSATSDIELNRVEGVHGPRTLVVLLVKVGATDV
jgi:L-lactate dehydrogenase complex protein LldG